MAEPRASKQRIIALVGNPNTGKSSLFNVLTGLRQKVGNFPGVTVERREADFVMPSGEHVRLLDLPGLYSLIARSPDEAVVTDVLLNPAHPMHPDVVVLVADASNLKRNLYLGSQVLELGIPVVLALTLQDVAERYGIYTDAEALGTELGIPVVKVNPRSGAGRDSLVALLGGELQAGAPFSYPSSEAFRTLLALHGKPEHKAVLADDTLTRYRRLEALVARIQTEKPSLRQSLTQRLDKVLLHPVWGYGIFLLVLFLIFQAVFSLASYPMDWIDAGVSWASEALHEVLPDVWLTRLIVEGLIPGIGGILVFVPQIAILFGLTAILEDTGYMARVIFISDKIMRRFGLSGRSVVPLFSGLACAVPAIMAARTIENRRERLLTILVTPFVSCSARLPVFTVLTALAVPERQIFGFISQQGLVLMAMYLIGGAFALASAWVLKLLVPSKGRTVFMLELPWFKAPRWQAVATEAYVKSRTFVVEAGKIILLISLILWFLASYGPGTSIEQADTRARTVALQNGASMEEVDAYAATAKLEASYAGRLGHVIEPAIRPLGFDWRIGISLIASFAAREVFVGTMATIHSVGQAYDDEATLVSRLRDARDPETGQPSYRPSVAFSLMIFYLLAMQCMSTFAIVRRELNSWSWAVGQLVGMTTLAWLCSWGVYQILD